MLRHKARSLLIAAMIALPVLISTLVLVTYETGDVDGDKYWRSQYGNVDVTLSYDPPGASSDAVLTSAQRQQQRAELIESLPPGSIYTDNEASIGEITIVAGERSVPIARTLTGPIDPVFDEGTVELVDGRTPVGPTEIALGHSDLDRLSVSPGDQVTVESRNWTGTDEPTLQVARATIVGSLEAPLLYDRNSFYLQGEKGPVSTAAGDVGQDVSTPSLRVILPAGMAPEEAFPTANIFPGEDVPESPLLVFAPMDSVQSDGNVIERIGLRASHSSGAVALLSVGVVMALLAIGLIVGAAFAVGARRSQRDLEMVSRSGASRRQLSLIVVTQGLALGLLGASSGVVLGLLAFLFARGSMQDVLRTRLDGTPVIGWQVAAVWLVCVLVSVAAAGAALRTVAAADGTTSSQAANRRGARSARVPKVAIALAVAGIVGCLATSDTAGRFSFVPLLNGLNQWAGSTAEPVSQGLLALFFVMIVMGAVLALPELLAFLSQRAQRASLVPRLALRDAGRARHRSAPTVAMVLAVTAISTSALIMAGAVDATREGEHRPAVPESVVAVDLDPYGQQLSIDQQRRRLDRIQQQIPGGQLLEANITDSELVGYCDPNPDAGGCWTAPIYVADAGLISALAREGTSEDAIRSHLVSGGVVVFESRRERASYSMEPSALDLDSDPGVVFGFENSLDPRTAPRISLRTMILEPRQDAMIDRMTFASEATVARIPSGQAKPQEHRTDRWAYFVLGQPMATGQLDAVNDYLAAYRIEIIGYEAFVPHSGELALMVTVAALGMVVLTIGVSTALATTEQSEDRRILRAIGASPRDIRRIAMTQATMLALLGIGIGALVGIFMGIYAMKTLPDQYPVALPIPQLLAMVAAVPVIAWLSATRQVPRN